MTPLETLADSSVWVLEALGILTITLGAVGSIGRGLWSVLRREWEGVVHRIRRDLGISILLGLELLVAADIIRTVAIEISLPHVATLGLVVVLRTLLSLTLEVETTGRWPWKQAESGMI